MYPPDRWIRACCRRPHIYVMTTKFYCHGRTMGSRVVSSLKSFRRNCHINNPRDYTDVVDSFRSLIFGRLTENLARDVDRSFCTITINYMILIKIYGEHNNVCDKCFYIFIIKPDSSSESLGGNSGPCIPGIKN